MKLFLSIILGLFSASIWSADLGLSNPAELATYISQQNHFLLYFAFYGLGILLAFTPCVLPMVPILSGIIVGQNAQNAKEGLRLSAAYVAGMTLTYAVAGMLAGWLGSTVQTIMQTPWVILTFSFVFVYLGLNLLDLVKLPFLSGGGRQQRSHSQSTKPKSLWSVGIMGVLSTLVVSPCVTGPLIGVLTYIGQTGQVIYGGILLFVMALGMGTPLLLVGSGYGKLLPKSGAWMILIKRTFAFMMFALAIWLSSRILPSHVTIALYGGLLLIAGLSMNLFKNAKHRAERIAQGFGVIMVMLSALMISKAVQPEQADTIVTAEAPFVQIKSERELDGYLAKAKARHQPVFMEFFAGWCSDCQAMDKNVFSLPKVHKAMANTLNLRVDISDKTPEVAQLRKRFAILGIPTMLFVDTKGNIQSDLTSVGQVAPTVVTSHLDSLNANKG